MKQATGAKGKALFQPLRLALTGREHGPELKLLLPLIGRAARAGAAQGQHCLALYQLLRSGFVAGWLLAMTRLLRRSTAH